MLCYLCQSLGLAPMRNQGNFRTEVIETNSCHELACPPHRQDVHNFEQFEYVVPTTRLVALGVAEDGLPWWRLEISEWHLVCLH